MVESIFVACERLCRSSRRIAVVAMGLATCGVSVARTFGDAAQLRSGDVVDAARVYEQPEDAKTDEGPAESNAPAVQEAGHDATSQDLDRLDDVLDEELEPALDLGDIDLLSLDIPVVVSSMRTNETAEHIPHSISIITADDIRLSGARTIPDALRLVPGVDIADLSFANSAVSPRGLHGFTASTLLVLIDGRQIFDSVYGGTVWNAWPIMLEDIERIEVVRGPASVLWGANAVSGLINIVTKDPAEQLGLTLRTRVGSRGHYRQYLGYGIKEQSLSLRVSAEIEGSDGFQRGGLLFPIDDDYLASRLTAKATYRPSDEDVLTFTASAGDTDGGFPTSPLAGLHTQSNGGVSAGHLAVQWDREASDDEKYRWLFFINHFEGDAGSKAVRYQYEQVALQFSHQFNASEDHQITWGIDTRLDFIDGTIAEPQIFDADSAVNYVIGAYLQDQWQLSDRWTLTLSGRGDFDFYGGFQPSARASLAYDIDEHSVLFGAVSRAFSMPPVGVRHLELPMVNGLLYTLGSRDLDSTILWAYEVGYRGKIGAQFDTSATLFWHEFYDESVFLPVFGHGPLLGIGLVNTSDFALYGFEWEGVYHVHPKVDLLANYTYQELNWKTPPDYSSTDRIAPPTHKGMIGVNYRPRTDWDLSTRLFYVHDTKSTSLSAAFGDLPIDSYVRWDIRAEHRFWDDRASVAIGVQNLLDTNHKEGETLFIDSAEVPRFFYGEFRLQIP